MEDSNYQKLVERIKQYLTLQIDYSKLTVAEKLSVLLSRMLLVTVVVLIAVVLLFFLATSLVAWLNEANCSPTVANLIVAAVVLVVLLIVVALRKTLFVTPVTRFVTRLFFDGESANTNSATNQTPDQQ